MQALQATRCSVHTSVHVTPHTCVTHRRVAGANHDELGGVHNRHTLTLNRVEARRRRVQHDIHKPVVQQVHLVHVQDAAVGLGLWRYMQATGVTGRPSSLKEYGKQVHLVHVQDAAVGLGLRQGQLGKGA